jgi:hypothetical protein
MERTSMSIEPLKQLEVSPSRCHLGDLSRPLTSTLFSQIGDNWNLPWEGSVHKKIVSIRCRTVKFHKNVLHQIEIARLNGRTKNGWFPEELLIDEPLKSLQLTVFSSVQRRKVGQTRDAADKERAREILLLEPFENVDPSGRYRTTI